MSYEWNLSAKGNYYTKINQRLCVVGKSKYGFWALVDEEFLQGKYDSLGEAKQAAVEDANRRAELDEILGVIDVDSE